MRNFNLGKHGDKLLFALAVAVLAAGLFRFDMGKAVLNAASPRVVFTHWWDDYLEPETIENLINEFEQRHGEIKISAKNMTYEDLRRVLFDASGSGEGGLTGDVIALDSLWVSGLLENKIIENAASPVLSFINVLYYNVDLLKDAGFTRPPKSRSEFLACAKAVAGQGGRRWGLTLGMNSPGFVYENIYPWIWAAGARLIDNGNPSVNVRAVTETLSFLAELNKTGCIAPNAPVIETQRNSSGSDTAKLEDFISGRAAFMIAPVRDLKFIVERMGAGAFDVTSIPVPDNYSGSAFYGITEWTTGVNSASEYREEAGLFADFLAEKASFLSEKSNVFSGESSSGASNNAAGNIYSKVWDITIAGESAGDFSGIAEANELDKVFFEELSALFAETSSPAETAAAIQNRWSETLDMSGNPNSRTGGLSGD